MTEDLPRGTTFDKVLFNNAFSTANNSQYILY